MRYLPIIYLSGSAVEAWTYVEIDESCPKGFVVYGTPGYQQVIPAGRRGQYLCYIPAKPGSY